MGIRITWKSLWIDKNSRDLKSGLVFISNGQKEVGLQMVQILSGIWNPEAQSFDRIKKKNWNMVVSYLFYWIEYIK